MPSQHRIVECSTCKKMMRSNNLRRHRRAKHEIFDKTLSIKVETKFEIDKGSCNSEDLKIEVLDNAKAYDQKIQLGETLHKLLMETNTKEESLSKQHKEAFDLYNKKRLAINPHDAIKLYPWQQHALECIRKPSYRQVIWIKGARGNEGKSWFQNYVQSLFGHDRVVQLNLKNTIGSIMQILRKLPLSTLDIFLVNDARSGQEDQRCYEMLESIKDGHGIASRYSSEILRFRTPNVVVVFSNAEPDVMQLSSDRWKILRIKKDGLDAKQKQLSKIAKV